MIDFEHIDGKLGEPGERAVSSAEIIQIHPQPERLDRLHHAQRFVLVFDQRGLGKLHFEQGRLDPGLRDGVLNDRHDTFALQLPHRKIHRHRRGPRCDPRNQFLA